MKNIILPVFLLCSVIFNAQVLKGLQLKDFELKGNVKNLKVITEHPDPYYLNAVEIYKFNKHGQLISEITKGRDGFITGVKNYEFQSHKSLNLKKFDESLMQISNEFIEYQYENQDSNFREAYELGHENPLMILEHTYKFDKHGNLIEYKFPPYNVISFGSNEKLSFENVYDSKNWLIEKKEFYTQDSINRKRLHYFYKYNSKNKLITEEERDSVDNSTKTIFYDQGKITKISFPNNSEKINTFSDSGELILSEYLVENQNKRTSFSMKKTFYNNGNVKTKTTIVNGDIYYSGILTTTTIFYNIDGIPIKETEKINYIDKHSNIISESDTEITTKIYKYDEQGNWINNGINTTRVIEYY